MTQLRTSLFWKLMLAFMAVVLVAVGSVALIARQKTSDEFYRLREGESQAIDRDQINHLAAFYAENASWEGVSFLTRSARGQNQGSSRGSGPPLRLVDADGQVLLNTLDGQVGHHLSPTELAQGEPIIVNGKRVGTLLQGGRSATSLSQTEQTFLDRVQQALVISALVAIGTALILGFVLFRNITAPLRRLTVATAMVESGELSTQVPVPKGSDEVSQLSLAFNRMTDGLARADQLRRDMTADIAHELRTPLTVIQGNLEAILDGVYPADEEHLEPVLRKTQLLRRLVEDLRTLALADAGELDLHLTPIDLRGVVQRTVRDFEVQAQAAQVSLVAVIAPQLPYVTADAGRIEQVLGILLDNALRHTPMDGQIEVRLSALEDKVWLSVRDTGAGISAEVLPNVFERFYRGKTDTQRSAGTGLGLAIAKAIVVAHAGDIWAESEFRKGTTVTFTLGGERP